MTPDNIPIESFEEEDDTILTPTEIYEQLTLNDELILTISDEDEDKLRKGLASAKNKSNARLKEAGLPIDSNVLQFITSPADEDGYITVHIILSQRGGIRIKKLELPDGDL